MLELLVADVNRVAAVIQAVLKDGPLITGTWYTGCIECIGAEYCTYVSRE